MELLGGDGGAEEGSWLECLSAVGEVRMLRNAGLGYQSLFLYCSKWQHL